MAYIEIKDLSYWYPEEKYESVKNLNMSIEKGEILFIVGKSGSGKSTLGKIISGAIPNFYGGKLRGNIVVNGRDLRNMTHVERAREITMVFQDPERQLVMNKVHREIAFGLENVGIEGNSIKRRVWEAMQFVNISELAYRDTNTLSGGQKQKVGIASAVSYLPECIILDEPTSQLDPTSAEEVVDLVKKINEELGITIIVIEQRVDRWFDIADKVAMMDKGMLIYHGLKEEFYTKRTAKSERFLPVYLRMAGHMNIEKKPQSIKNMRSELNKYSFRFKDDEQVNAKTEDGFIQVKNLNINYGQLKALKNINLAVKQGDFIGILGANGAGKSTLLKTITGLNKYEGSVRLNEKEVKKLKLQDISQIAGYVSQNPNDYISKDTVYEEIRFTLDNHGIREYDAIEDVLKKLDIYALKDKNPRDISGGERQRVAIATMLVSKPSVLLLDEPTRGLDADIKIALGEVLRELNKQGTTILLVTHDVEFASEFCSRFILMFNGEITADGNREQVMTNGIYYTTTVNKLLRHVNSRVFSLNQIVEMKKL